MKFLVAVILAVSCIPNSDKKSETKALKFNSMSKYLARISKVLTKNAQNISSLHKNISNIERIKVIENIPVSELMSAPGHLALRKPEAVKAMAESIEQAADGGVSFVKGQDPIVLNVFTEKAVSESGSAIYRIKSIEVMDGNHRLAAGFHAKFGDSFQRVEAGALANKKDGSPVWQFVRDIPKEALEVRVNGHKPNGRGVPVRWIPLKIFSGQSCTLSSACKSFREGQRGYYRVINDDRGGQAVEVSGGLSSIDDVIPDKYKGKTIHEVMQCSLSKSCN